MKHIDLTNKRGAAKDHTINCEEFDILYEKLKSDKHKVILLLGARAGMRVGEIIQCRLSWLKMTKMNDSEILEINIPDEDRDLRNKMKIWRPKTKKKRTTYILDNAHANFVYMWFKFFDDGLNMSRQNISTEIVSKHFCKIVGKKITTHGLRATCQNYWGWTLEVSPRFIQACLGHSDFNTTMKHYNTMNKESTNDYLVNYTKNNKS